MPETRPKFGLRPMLPEDVPLLAEIFRASVEGLTDDDYSPEQQEAWISVADDEAAFDQRLADQLTLVATLQGDPIAFASLKGTDEIDMVYVHATAAREGAATMLVDALEKLAEARGAKRLTTDASDTAADFFAGRGYVAQLRNTLLRGDEWLSNTTMTKQLVVQDNTSPETDMGGNGNVH
jgi:putative acetyltransferase